jgi:type VI secretion system secreted protein Hcp
MPIYMNWGATSPPEITGDVSVADYRNWIELEAVTPSTRGNVPQVGAGASRQASAPHVSELVIMKQHDSSSNHLYKKSQSGHGTSVQIHFLKRVGGKLQVYMTLNLYDVYVSGYAMSANAGKPLESISLNAGSVGWGAASAVTPHASVHQWDLHP